ncbi:hypothetical protein BU24DRAFT_171937 [Aaosphaeria arxii CBS 175.79]|uniref:Uncharacterized protein n=1 Tax=Aaosphaeria arxii CBS 175.79 TaxID=1450172 RepID=A0A6A5XZR8_9PLEO|nr:uncharacterized protein BU24DRAFT_171937 [Aaosphaeria arxii CBS 175.79]KAF2018489.1 hypothetical protein BU24DRAFT_171937 [Aaosphaeria arxii CBS 175.79]
MATGLTTTDLRTDPSKSSTRTTTTATSTIDKMDRGEKKGFRRSLRKWRDRMKSQKKIATTSTSPSLARHNEQTSSQQQQREAPITTSQTVNPFPPTTQTIISSPLDRRSSQASSPAILPSKPFATRRNTAPADYFSSQPTSATSKTAVAPINSITTTISANTPAKKGLRSRLSASFSSSSATAAASVARTSSPVPPPTSTSTSSRRSSIRPQPISPTPSAPNPVDHPNRRATFQFTTAAEIAAQTKLDSEKLKAAAEVIRRDKPKDWMDPAWRDKEDREVARLKKVMEEEGNDVGVAPLRASKSGEDGPLKRWEWGR